MSALVPVTDDHEMIVAPDMDALGGFHGRVYVLLKNGKRWMKVPARIEHWEDPATRGIHIVVEHFAIRDAEEWHL